jgi:preprotein translocase SecE subunit
MFAREIADELRHMTWPSRRKAGAAFLVVVLAAAGMAGLVFGADEALIAGLDLLSGHILALPAAAVTAIQVLSACAAGALLIRHPGPSTATNLFGASAADTDPAPVTSSERRLHRHTVVAVVVFLAATLVHGMIE